MKKAIVIIIVLCAVVLVLGTITVMQHGEIEQLTNQVGLLDDDVQEAKSEASDAKDAAQQTQEDIEDLKNK